MNTQRLFIFATVACATVATFLYAPSHLVPTAQAQETSIQKWEYMTAGVNMRKLDNVNALGAEGWELAQAVTTSIWVFKRPVP